MSNQAKLRVIFDRYNISPKATKNFINYFMSHAKLRIGADINEESEVIEKLFTECNNHEDDNYKFIISAADLAVPTNDDGENNEIIVGDVCTVSGTMSNASTGESVGFSDDIFKLDKVDDNYELNIKSKQLFDEFNLTVKVAPKYDETYAAIVQDNYSHVAGYNFQIPIAANNYKRGIDKLWHASVNREYAIGMNFCQVLIGNREDDEVKLKLIKDPAKAYCSVAPSEQGYFTVHAVVDGAAGDRYKLSLSQLIDNDTSAITGVRVEIFEDNNVIFANNIIKTPHNDKVIIPVSDFESLKDETDSNKNFTDYLTPSGSKVIVSDAGLELQLVYNDITKVVFEIYLNNKLYARSFATQITRLTDESWPANILMTTFNQTNSRGFRMIRFDDNGDVISDNTYFGEYINMYNYSGEAAYLWLNLNDVDDVEITMQPATDYLLTHNKESALAAQLSNKEISSKLLAFKTAYEYDRGRRCMNTADSNFNIPVSLKIVSASGKPLDKDTFPYSNFIDEYDNNTSPFIELHGLRLPKPKDKVEYSLKTPVFTINCPNDSGGYEIINAYYKLGICALDGLDSSSEKLLNSFIKKSYIIVHQTDYAVNENYMYYTFAIKPKLEYMNEQKFYSVSEKFQLLDRASTITDRNNLICSTALRPIVEINSLDQSKNTLLGVLYMDMFNADDDSIITTGWAKNKKLSITINGEPALDKELEITKI